MNGEERTVNVLICTGNMFAFPLKGLIRKRYE